MKTRPENPDTARSQDASDPDFLRDRAKRFYRRYGGELEQIAGLLLVQLRQLAFAYTLNHRLPPEAIVVTTRVKSEASFLRKLEDYGWPSFYYPTDVVHDLIGGRVACWFVDDCEGMAAFIRSSSHFTMASPQANPEKNFIDAPKPSGYRAVHLFGDLTYDAVQRVDGTARVTPEKIICEIQVRSRLQDAWGDITHEFHYKAKSQGIDDPDLEAFLADIAERLATEDRTLSRLRDTYQRLVDEKTVAGERKGFVSE